MHPCELYWLIVGSVGCGFEWPGFGEDLANHLDGRLRAFRIHQLRGTTRIRDAFAAVFNEHSCEGPDPGARMLREGSARAALQSLLIDLARAQVSPGLAEAALDCVLMPANTAQVIEALHANTHEPDAIRVACRLAGLDLDAVNRQFVETLGTTIFQYWLRERVRLARERLLKGPASITEIATQLGFSSSQHFATAFRKITGLTPSEYRNKAISDIEASSIE